MIFNAALLFLNHTFNFVFLKRIKDLLHDVICSQTTAFEVMRKHSARALLLCVCNVHVHACVLLSDFLVVAWKCVSLVMGNMCSSPSAQLCHAPLRYWERRASLLSLLTPFNFTSD